MTNDETPYASQRGPDALVGSLALAITFNAMYI